MEENEMDELRHSIIEGIQNYMDEYDWDKAFVKFFGDY